MKIYLIIIDRIPVEVSEEIYWAYYRSKRRDRYYERDIKAETPILDGDGIFIGYAPSKEDSLDRLMATGTDFPDNSESVEDCVLRAVMTERLHECLALLSDDERALIRALYFDGITEREYAVLLGIRHQSVNERKRRILAKLKIFFK